MNSKELSRISTTNPYENPDHALPGRDIGLARAHVIDALAGLGVASLTIKKPAGVEAPVRKHGVIMTPERITYTVNSAGTAAIEMRFEQPSTTYTHRLQLFKPSHPHDLPSGAYYHTTDYGDGDKSGRGERLTCGDRAVLGACLGVLTLAKESAQEDAHESLPELLTTSA